MQKLATAALLMFWWRVQKPQMQKWEQLQWKIFAVVVPVVTHTGFSWVSLKQNRGVKSLAVSAYERTAGSGERQEMCQPSSLMFSYTLLIYSCAQAHLYSAVCRLRFVMMSPSFPLKVDAGGLSPQPETPDTPVTPYLSSPDEVTSTWEGGWWGQWHETKPLHPDPFSAPSPFSSNWSAFGEVPRLLTACRQHDLTLSIHLVPQCTHANSDITNQLPHTFNCMNQYHSGTFNEQLIIMIAYDQSITLTNHHTRTQTFTPDDDDDDRNLKNSRFVYS